MKVVWPVPEDFWWEVARASPEATFFHTPLWHRLIAEVYPGWRDASAGFELDGGGRAVLPMLETSRPIRGLFRDLVSTFGGCYGGLIADGRADGASLTGAWKAVLGSRRLAHLHLTGNPLSSRPSPPGVAAAREDFTHLLDLSPGYPAVLQGFSQSTRRWIRKAQGLGMTVSRAREEPEFRAYFEVYEDSLRRWGDRATSRYPSRLFEVGRMLGLEHPGVMDLWLARLEERIVAGAWVFSWNQHVGYWHGATLEDALPAGPGHLLQAAILEDACARGARFYDFNPSGGHEGVARFKSGFGAHKRAVPRFEICGPLFPAASAVVRALRG